MTIDELLERARAICREELATDHPAGVRSVDLDPAGLLVDDLNQALGAPRALPRMPFADPVLGYEVHVEAAAYRCSVFAATPDGVSLSRLTLRQDP